MMPGGRRYGGIIMGDNGISSSANALEALLSSPVFHGSRSLANLQDVIGNVSKRPFCNTLDAEETGDEDLDDCIHPPEKKRRLTSEQVQFLEKSFEIENKLEPERKIRLARDLGLQPRQVAVWFQNRRARWKTKQLERDYGLLKSSYDNLSVEYDSLLKEKEKLRTEVILLIDKLHAKDKDLQIQTNDTDTIDKQSSLQAVAKFEGFEKSEMATSIKDPQMSFKHEDLLSSGTDSSGVVDEDSPRRIDCSHSSVVDHVASSHNFEPDQSDLSHVEEEEEEEEGISGKLLPQTYNLLKLEDGIYPDASAGSCNYMLAMEDQVHLPWNFSWDWPYLA